MTKPGIPIEERFWMKVNKTDSCWEWTAYKQPAGYGTFTISAGNKDYAHRLTWMYKVGPIPEGAILDHTCHNRACVNPSHLRLSTPKLNMENRSTAHKNSTTGIRGVFWAKDKGRWVARVRHNRKTIHVGYYEDIAEAAEQVRLKRLELFSHSDMDL